MRASPPRAQCPDHRRCVNAIDQLLGFIPCDNNDRHARAYEQLKQSAGYAYITDVAVKESWTYLFLATGYTTTFRATAYPKTAAATAPAEPAR